MPTITRSQAKTRQPMDLVTSFMTSPSRPPPPPPPNFRRLTHSRQDNAVMANKNHELGSPSFTAADWNFSVASYTLGKCHRPSV